MIFWCDSTLIAVLHQLSSFITLTVQNMLDWYIIMKNSRFDLNIRFIETNHFSFVRVL